MRELGIFLCPTGYIQGRARNTSKSHRLYIGEDSEVFLIFRANMKEVAEFFQVQKFKSHIPEGQLISSSLASVVVAQTTTRWEPVLRLKFNTRYWLVFPLAIIHVPCRDSYECLHQMHCFCRELVSLLCGLSSISDFWSRSRSACCQLDHVATLDSLQLCSSGFLLGHENSGGAPRDFFQGFTTLAFGDPTFICKAEVTSSLHYYISTLSLYRYPHLHTRESRDLF